MSSGVEAISLPPSELPQETAAEDFSETVPQPESPPDEYVPQEPSTEEEKNERRVLIRKVMRYRALFPSELTDVDLSNLGSRALEELRDIGRDVEFLVSTRRSAKAVRSMFIGGVQVLEKGGGVLGLEIEGLTAVVAQSTEILETVDEAAVRHESCCEVDPLYRILLQLSTLMMALDSHNRQKKLVAPPAQPDVVASQQAETVAKQLAAASTPILSRKEYVDL
jgi:hypothetical protein